MPHSTDYDGDSDSLATDIAQGQMYFDKLQPDDCQEWAIISQSHRKKTLTPHAGLLFRHLQSGRIKVSP